MTLPLAFDHAYLTRQLNGDTQVFVPGHGMVSRISELPSSERLRELFAQQRASRDTRDPGDIATATAITAGVAKLKAKK